MVPFVMPPLALAWPAAVVFDMDGLLLDSERVALNLFAQAAAELNLPWEHKVGLRMIGLNSRESDKRVLQAFGADYPIATLRKRFGDLYEELIDRGGISTKPFAHELLQALKENQIPCAVATSTQRTRAELKLARSGLLPYFQVLACGDEVARSKPAPDIFLLAAERLGQQPEQCLVLEDSNAGVRGAVAAGMSVVMVPDLLEPDPEVIQMGVPCIESLKDVLDYFQS